MFVNLHDFYNLKGAKLIVGYGEKPVDIDVLARQITLNQAFSRDRKHESTLNAYVVIVNDKGNYRVATVGFGKKIGSDILITNPDNPDFHDFIIAESAGEVTVEDELGRASIWLPEHLRNLRRQPLIERCFDVDIIEIEDVRTVDSQTYADVNVAINPYAEGRTYRSLADYWEDISHRSLLQKPTSETDSLKALEEFRRELNSHPDSKKGDGQKASVHVRNLIEMIRAQNYPPRRTAYKPGQIRGSVNGMQSDDLVYRVLLENPSHTITRESEFQLKGVKIGF